MDAVLVDPFHRSDRDGDLLAVPQVSFLQEDVRDVPLACDDEPFDPPDAAVGCVHRVTASDLGLPGRNPVDDHRGLTLVEPVVGPCEHRPRVAGVGHVRDELDVVELG